jgi:hypothetical protein
MPWSRRQPAQPVPASEGGYGWADRPDRSGRARRAGSNRGEQVQRRAAQTDRHEQAPADQPDFGTADRPDYGTADRPGTSIGTAPALPIGTADRHDLGPGEWHDDRADADADADADRDGDADAATHHIVVPNDERGADERRADVVRVGGAEADAAGPARRRYPVTGSLRFWNEEIRLRDLLHIVRQGDYNMSHILVVRAANIAFFWLVTAPVVTAAFCFLWAFAVSLHRALTIAVVGLVAAQAVPIVSWLLVSTWSATTWQWVGGATLVFGVGTAIVAAVERQR